MSVGGSGVGVMGVARVKVAGVVEKGGDCADARGDGGGVWVVGLMGAPGR